MVDKKKNPLPTSIKILIALVVGLIVGALFVQVAHAKDVFVQGHVRSDGTYVQPHYRSAPDQSQYNNYGSQGNYNPYTGQQGTVQPQPYYGNPYPAPTYNNRGQSSIGTYPR